MKSLFNFIIAVLAVVVILGACNSNKSSESNTESLSPGIAGPVNRIKAIEKPDAAVVSARGGFIDSLDIVYSDYDFSSFCVIKADLDSIFLVSDFMAGALIGADNFSQQRIKIAEVIEKEKVREYCQQHGIPHKKVLGDLMQLAMKRPNPCQRYLDYRYDEYKRKIHNDISFDLHVEAHKKYFDLM